MISTSKCLKDSLVLLFIDLDHVWDNNWGRTPKSFFVVWPWVNTIAFTSPAINPFIYYFQNQEFRKAFRRTFRWLPCRLAKKSSQQTGLKPGRHLALGKGVTSGDAAIKETEL